MTCQEFRDWMEHGPNDPRDELSSVLLAIYKHNRECPACDEWRRNLRDSMIPKVDPQEVATIRVLAEEMKNRVLEDMKSDPELS